MTRQIDSRGNEYFEQAERFLRAMQIEEALSQYARAERAGHDPDACAGGRWICDMLLGRFERAWEESDAIAARGRPDRHRFWDGRPLDGRRVLVRCLHGLGDTIQFIRYAPLIRERASALIVEAQPALRLLLEQSRIADRVITWGELEPPWDQQVEIVELPRIFRTTIHNIPSQVPYLDVCSMPAAAGYDGRRRLRIGVVWASSSYNPLRTIPLEQMARIFEVPGTSFFSLQAGAERDELSDWPGKIVDAHIDEQCVAPAAAALKTLDLMVTVDTMMAHLAGAMARPVWTLLPFQCDWRWMMEREDSPWYPTMRLFRQSRAGEWGPVIERVKLALQAVIEGRPSLKPRLATAPAR